MLQWTWSGYRYLFSFPLDNLFGSGVTGLYGSSSFNFWETPILFSIVALPIYFPTVAPFSPHHHQHLLFVVFLMTVILTGMVWEVTVGLICICLMSQWSWASFHIPVATRISSFFKIVYLLPLLGFKSDYYLLCFAVVWVLYVLWILIPYQIRDWKYFLSFRRLLFHFADGFLCCAEVRSLGLFYYLVFFSRSTSGLTFVQYYLQVAWHNSCIFFHLILMNQ